MKILNIRFIKPSGDGGYYSNHEQICEIYDKDSLNIDEIQWILDEEEFFEVQLLGMLSHGWALKQYIYKFCDRFFAIRVSCHSDYGFDIDAENVMVEVIPYTYLASGWKVKKYHEYE